MHAQTQVVRETNSARILRAVRMCMKVHSLHLKVQQCMKVDSLLGRSDLATVGLEGGQRNMHMLAIEL